MSPASSVLSCAFPLSFRSSSHPWPKTDVLQKQVSINSPLPSVWSRQQDQRLLLSNESIKGLLVTTDPSYMLPWSWWHSQCSGQKQSPGEIYGMFLNNKQLINLKTSDNNYKTSDNYISAQDTVERLQFPLISLHILLTCQGSCSDIFSLD